tara:strand:- start:2185 stop:2937 length:753 start_codon:yes stop_codon:yes gene_type:complete
MESPDILCLQETKAHPNQLTSELTEPDGYTADYAAAQKKGYSGVSIWTRSQNIAHTFTPSNSQQTSPRIISPPTSGVKINRFDEEGRVLTCDYENFTLVNSYFPNSQRSLDRLSYKLDFYECMLGYCNRLRRNGKRVIICGDFNTAHHEIDLARPKENRGNSGFLPEEREHLNRFTEEGYVDVFRYFHPEGNHYTWWSYQFNARANNIGWRIDYFLVSEDLLASLEDCYHLTDTYGSDHCPVVMKIASAR